MSSHNSDREKRNLPPLRFLTCGSVDDGKSTLIGRLLWEQNAIFDDQMAALKHDSKKYGVNGQDVDFALLVDGLETERQQGITVDVAYRFFRTTKRSFVVADTPGHEQFTRNMASGASLSDVAVILVDARKGLLSQTRRHLFIVSMLGIRHIVLAVNKMDLVEYNQGIFDSIVRRFTELASRLDNLEITSIPMSAKDGVNLSNLHELTSWYKGPPLIEYLENVDVSNQAMSKSFRMPVQWVNRPTAEFRGYSGTISRGNVSIGEEVVVANSGRVSKIAQIVTPDGCREFAQVGDAITLVLEDPIDIARGDLLVDPLDRPECVDSFTANLIWMDEGVFLPGQSYYLKVNTRTILAVVKSIDCRIDVQSFDKNAATSLRLNEFGKITVSVAGSIPIDNFYNDASLGAFILICRETNRTVAAGMIEGGVRRSTNIHPQIFSIDRVTRAKIKNHKRAGVLWFTGLSGSGKSTVADAVEQKLNSLGAHTMILDGDNIRHGLNKDLGFSYDDRIENIRRVAEVARLMTDAGLFVLCCFISPFRMERALARAVMPEDEFLEIFVNTPLETCIRRDRKGLYKRALAGEIKHFTGIDQAYEVPHDPDMIVGQENETVEQASERIIDLLFRRGFLDHN